MAVKNLPSEPGFYWARSGSNFEWYDMIVRVYGVAPFFRMEAWLRSDVVSKYGEIHLHEIYDFGPEIVRPEVPEEIIKPR